MTEKKYLVFSNVTQRQLTKLSRIVVVVVFCHEIKTITYHGITTKKKVPRFKNVTQRQLTKLSRIVVGVFFVVVTRSRP